jgi:hypothetical protein
VAHIHVTNTACGLIITDPTELPKELHVLQKYHRLNVSSQAIQVLTIMCTSHLSILRGTTKTRDNGQSCGIVHLTKKLKPGEKLTELGRYRRNLTTIMAGKFLQIKVLTDITHAD